MFSVRRFFPSAFAFYLLPMEALSIFFFLSTRAYPQVFNPLINPRTGELDLSIQFATWNPNQHYIVLLLAYVKKIFYKVNQATCPFMLCA